MKTMILPSDIKQGSYREKSLRWKNSQKVFVALCGIILITICVCRPLSSSDTKGYYNLYIETINNRKPFIEQSFQYISKIGYTLFGIEGGFRFLLLIYACITWYILIRVIKQCENKLLSFFIWFSFAFVFQMMIQMRSAVGNLLFLWSLQDITEKNYRKYYIKIFVAIFFHAQSFIFLFIYPCVRVVLKYRKLLYILPPAFILAAYTAPYFLDQIIPFLINSKFEYLAQKVEVYTLKYYTDVWTNPINRISLVLFAIFYFEIIIVGIKRLMNDEVVYITICAVSIFCYFLGKFTIPIIALRYPECFNLVLIVLLPVIGYRRLKRSINEFKILMFVYLFLINIQYNTFRVIASALFM